MTSLSLPRKSKTRKQRRLVLIGSALGMFALAVGLVLYAMRDTIVFYYDPSVLAEKAPQIGTRLRIGGLVKQGTLVRSEGNRVSFTMTDLKRDVTVTYQGLLPDLFREGQGAVAEGVLGPDFVLQADAILAKHDERYMPREVADTLKKQGLWQESGAPAAAAGK
jgi:cytochrome c-type biogenesis protein CcmE